MEAQRRTEETQQLAGRRHSAQRRITPGVSATRCDRHAETSYGGLAHLAGFTGAGDGGDITVDAGTTTDGAAVGGAISLTAGASLGTGGGAGVGSSARARARGKVLDQ